MSGVVFIITIPTRAEEKALRKEPRQLDFEKSTENILPSQTKAKLSDVSLSRTSDIQSLLTTPLLPIRKSRSSENIVIQIDKTEPSEKTASVELCTGTGDGSEETDSTCPEEMKQLLEEPNESGTLKKTKSFENLENANTLDVNEDPSALRKSWEGLKDIVSSGRKNRSVKKKKEDDDLLEMSPDSPMEVVLKEILKKVKIENSTWTKSYTGSSYQVTFAMEYDQRYEKLLQQLQEWGIGEREGSSVSILPCTAFYDPSKNQETNDDPNDDDINAEKESAWNRFMNSVRTRLNMAQIVEEVKQDAMITFDFVLLVISAAVLAAFGLVENSTIFLASSMLISPLMGPVIAAIFGTVIKDRKLMSLGVCNELFGIFLATFVGFVFGLIICSIDKRYGMGEGLSSEMLSRCDFHSVVVGIMAAIPSGVAVAIAILGKNIGSLVGVAISASLLPPAVNSGLMWALACIYTMFENDTTKYNLMVKTNFYSQHQATELAILGSISMLVTITNVICIFVMGMIVLKIKEVAPVVSRNQRQFWKHDLKLARDYTKSCQSEEGMSFTRKLADEIVNMPPEDQEAFGIDVEMLRTASLAKASYQNTWSPMSSRLPFHLLDGRQNIHDLERLYMTMSRPNPDTNRMSRGSLAGTSKAAIGRSWSPPKFKSHTEDHSILSALHKRASMPFDALISPPKKAANFKASHLEKIYEDVQSSNVESDRKKKKRSSTDTTSSQGKMSRGGTIRKSRIFTVTPANNDPLQKKGE